MSGTYLKGIFYNAYTLRLSFVLYLKKSIIQTSGIVIKV